jgi:hypothetical protein
VRRERTTYAPGLSTSTIGAIAELKVGADLLGKGYAVFRALSPACRCDLVILSAHRAWTVEVRTGYYTPAGTLIYSGAQIRADVVAILTPTGIVYRPALETLHIGADAVATEG